MKLVLTNSAGAWDITKLASITRWAGDYTQIARTLDIGILASPTDKSIPAADMSLGAGVNLFENNETLFSGFIMSRTKSTDGNLLNVSCFDRGFYLKKNKTIKKYTARQPENVARELCAEFGIEVGFLAATDFSFNRNFITPTSLWDVITTAYTLASRSNGKHYHIGFRGDKLYVTEKGPSERTLIIRPKSNLIATNVTESIVDMINAVAIYDNDGNFLRTVENDEYINLYGRMQDAIKQTANDDQATAATRLLENGGPSQKITLDNLGNIANIAGGSVVVQEAYTGLYGLFYIDSDVHEWKRGQYYNKLVVNYKRLMDEREAGSLPNADGSKTATPAVDSGNSYRFEFQGREVSADAG